MSSISLLAIQDNTRIEIDKKTASHSNLIKTLIEEFEGENIYEIPYINGFDLNRICDFMSFLNDNITKEIPKPLLNNSLKDILTDYENDFINFYEDNIYELFALLKAVDYLGIQRLLEICCAKIAILIRDYDSETFNEVFQIESDMTEDDLNKMKEEYEKIKLNKLMEIRL
jgi:hypothetical protein